ncbi:3-oxoacyl-[acyl-carrier-protein] synthase III C-terminal domain-containing protein [Tropicibacter oceani]|uniref:3-oxoacyl-[acyl-carrier-protein] synthase III C-terminal domain-containing protein n=1 Tax=Tropicibacter oceani TaxID=3058420 RepID=A0ABY8QIR2_9RHOB|nr:3-oxoacyl-[acyl-carrier-protein] synthase III C-terminal domain-containing protein [Tropicibacter oceani]WGW04522.1 3-oxoacyl-[acyl-carrier-protein] synthase III C-terminal domain-containing protein [Tropicibacter oceani]
MFDILDIETTVSARSITVSQACAQLTLSNKDRRMYERFFGLASIPSDPTQSLNVMTGAAIARLLEGPEAPDLVVHCHTLLSSGPCRSDSAVPVHLIEAGKTEVFSATMCHCASGVAVLEMVESLLPENGTALIVVSDKAFHPAVQLIRNTTLMGDGAAAILVGKRPGRFRYLGGHTERLGAYSIITGLVGEETDTAFADEYIEFTARCIELALVNAGITIADVRLILPHNVNIPSWDQIAQRIGAARDQIWLKNVSRYAHTFGADPFLNLADADRDGALAPGDHVALVSVGLGATAACAVLQVNPPVDGANERTVEK